MICCHQYPENLSILLRKCNNKYIPRRIKPNESLKIHHKYWLQDFESIVKVEELFYIDDDVYYTIKDCSTGRYAAISVNDNSLNYELFVDYDNLLDISEIVNTDRNYTGAEIRAWFFYNGTDSKIYGGFYSYLDLYDNKHSISDTKSYYLIAIQDERTKKYLDCKLSFKNSFQ